MNNDHKYSYDSTSGMRPLLPDEFERLALEGTLVIDTRPDWCFAKGGHIPGSVNVDIECENFLEGVQIAASNPDQPVLLLAESGKEEESYSALTQAGCLNIAGYLMDGFESWRSAKKPSEMIHRISATQFAGLSEDGDLIIDVRTESEFTAAHLKPAINRPLANIGTWAPELKVSRPFYLYCQDGSRSMTAASILKSLGIHNFLEIGGGFTALAATGLALKKQTGFVKTPSWLVITKLFSS